jgi:glycosyltransferase involved in cell wall biosynthesis
MGTNMGLAASRNVGAHSATGEYLAFLDADDQVLPDYYSRAIKVLNEYNNIHFVGCWVQYFGQSEQTWPAWTPEPPYFLVRNTLNSSSLVYKKSSFLEAGLNDQELKFGLEDYESVIHLKSKGYNGVVLPEPLFLYRVRENSMIQRFNDAKWLRSYQYIIQKHGVYFAEYSVEIQNLLHANGPGYWNNNPSRSPLARSNSASFLWMMARGKKIARRFPLLKPYLLQLKKVLYDNNIN